MVDNNDPISQPAVPYVWPNCDNGIFPGYPTLYGSSESKDIPDTIEIEGIDYVAAPGKPSGSFCGKSGKSSKGGKGSKSVEPI